jgi:hypothetical protein
VHAETDAPPLVTASWLREHAKNLTRLQIDGEVCVYCGAQPRTMMPVGQMGTRRLWACTPACEPARGPNRP